MQTKHTQGRLEQFSDGVFAIAITLLAIELHVPLISAIGLGPSVTEVLPLVPGLFTFILSFFGIAIFWVNHHQLTQEIGPVRRRLLWTNVLHLCFITLIPFGTKVVSVNPLHPLAIMTYSFIVFAASLSFTLLRYFVHTSCGERKVPMGRSLVGPVIYALAIVAAPFSVLGSYILLAIPPLFYFLPKAHPGK